MDLAQDDTGGERWMNMSSRQMGEGWPNQGRAGTQSPNFLSPEPLV